jgi:RNase P/RNase MRP subunit p30
MVDLFDLNVCMKSKGELDSYISMAKKLGFTGFAVQGIISTPVETYNDGFSIINRFDLQKKSKRSMKNQVKRNRRNFVIISAPLLDVNFTNWAAEEATIDIITIVPPFTEHKLRRTTAKLAVANGTVLEIPINPLLTTDGMVRARILKSLRESVSTATAAGMSIILSSHAKDPVEMRSPYAMRYIGQLLGIDASSSKTCIYSNPAEIVSRNVHKLDGEYISEGIEIVDEVDGH